MSTPCPQTERLILSSNPEFLNTLKTRVLASINTNGSTCATPSTYKKAIVVLSWFLLSYVGLFLSHSTALSILLCFSLSLATAAVGFNIFHDAIHGAFSNSRSINQAWAFLTCSLIGPSHFIWRHKHNYLHHQFPNIQNWDDDLETREGLRLSPSQPWSIRYRFQHIYFPFIYAMTTIEWFFLRDFIRYFTLKMNRTQKLPRLKLSDHVEFWVSKAIYLGLTVVLPLSFFSPLTYLAGFLIIHLTTSIILAVVFQLAHVMEECQFPLPNKDSGKIEFDWAALQLATTVNFAPQNRILNWYCGGLNFQVEHHLFPKVCHAYYKDIAPIVQATAKDFGHTYRSIPNHWAAIRSHYVTLKRLAQDSTIAS